MTKIISKISRAVLMGSVVFAGLAASIEISVANHTAAHRAQGRNNAGSANNNGIRRSNSGDVNNAGSNNNGQQSYGTGTQQNFGNQGAPINRTNSAPGNLGNNGVNNGAVNQGNYGNQPVQQQGQVGDGGYAQLPAPDSGGYAQLPAPDSGGYAQLPPPNNGGYGQLPPPASNNGVYGPGPAARTQYANAGLPVVDGNGRPVLQRQNAVQNGLNNAVNGQQQAQQSQYGIGPAPVVPARQQQQGQAQYGIGPAPVVPARRQQQAAANPIYGNLNLVRPNQVSPTGFSGTNSQYGIGPAPVVPARQQQGQAQYGIGPAPVVPARQQQAAANPIYGNLNLVRPNQVSPTGFSGTNSQYANAGLPVVDGNGRPVLQRQNAVQNGLNNGVNGQQAQQSQYGAIAGGNAVFNNSQYGIGPAPVVPPRVNNALASPLSNEFRFE